MRDYFIRRFLLLFPTLLVITVIVFAVTRIAPGGPLEQAMMEMQQVSMEGGGGTSVDGGLAMSKEQLQQMKELYGYDKPAHEAYLIWLGVLPREYNKRGVVFAGGNKTAMVRMRVPNFHIAKLDWDGDGFVQRSEVPESMQTYVKFDQLDVNRDGMIDGNEAESPKANIERPREPVQLKRNENGQVRIANIKETLVPWEVRMVHPFDGLMKPLESAYEKYLSVAPEGNETWDSFGKEFSGFVQKARADRKLEWRNAYQKLHDEYALSNGDLSKLFGGPVEILKDLEAKIDRIKDLGVKVRGIKDRESVSVARKDLQALIEDLKAVKVGIEEVNGVTLETRADKVGDIWGCSSPARTTGAPSYRQDSENSQITVKGIESLGNRVGKIKHSIGMWADAMSKFNDSSSEDPKAEIYRTEYAGVLQGDLGKSFRHGESVLSVMWERLPVSAFYGVLTFFFTYLVCVPLGIAKAVKHNTWFDNGSSIFIFTGYAVPGYVLGALMVVFLAARWEIFPTGGFVSENFHSTPVTGLSVKAGSDIWIATDHGLQNGEEIWLEGQVPVATPLLEVDTAYHVEVSGKNTFKLLPDWAEGAAPIQVQVDASEIRMKRHTKFGAQIADLTWHAVLPLCCYLIGSFAFVTMLMKNHLMDNLSTDYMRTAIAKGVPFNQAVRRHALRNSLIPLATNLGHQITLFVAGSFLIETIFDINGFGLLGFTAVLHRDIPVVMGIFLLSATLMLIGNIISDILVAMVDPRVRFD